MTGNKTVIQMKKGEGMGRKKTGGGLENIRTQFKQK